MPGQAFWPRYRSGAWRALRPGGRSVALADPVYAAQHQCGVWNLS